MIPTLDWKNTRDLYIHYVNNSECPEWFVEFAARGGFDDEWSYYKPRSGAAIVKRRPLWMGKSKKMPAEKVKR